MTWLEFGMACVKLESSISLARRVLDLASRKPCVSCMKPGKTVRCARCVRKAGNRSLAWDF